MVRMLEMGFKTREGKGGWGLVVLREWVRSGSGQGLLGLWRGDTGAPSQLTRGMPAAFA